MAMKGNNSRSQEWLLLALWALSSMQGASAAQVCTTNSEGKTVCHNKLSTAVIAAIVVTGVLVILICFGIYYVIRRTRAHRMNGTLANTFAIPALGYSSRNRRRDEEEGDSEDDDEKYLSVEKNQIHGPAWEARYDPSSAPGSAPLPGKGSWSSRLRNLKSGGLHSSEYGQQPMSAPGHGHRFHTSSGSQSASSSSSSVRKPRSAGSDPIPAMSMVSKGGSKRHHWGNLIHGSGSGSKSRSGSRSAGTSSGGGATLQPAKQARTRVSPGLQITAPGPGGYNSPIIPPIAPHTPRTPSRLGTAPPVSAGPEGFTSAPLTPLTSRTAGMAGTATPLTPRPVPAYSPVTPRGNIGAI